MRTSVPSTLSKVYCTLSLIALGCLGEAAAAAQEAGIPQPIPFSHRLHAGRERMACVTCHAETGPRGQHMSIAQPASCLGCHRTVVKGRDVITRAAGKKLQWEPVWFLPDFVWFSHRTHARATGCVTCHGPVEQLDVLWRQVETNMKFCRNCHKQTGAKAECGTCHVMR